MLRFKYNPITFVWGPPGTGKTYILARIAAINIFRASMSCFREEDALRYGANVGDVLATFDAQFVNVASVVGATLAKAASDTSIYEREFDIVILDETSMAYIPQIAFFSNAR